MMLLLMMFTSFCAWAGNGDTYVVDCNGGGEYTSISAAVADATGGETIFIKNGEYNENATITIGCNLTIEGESQDEVRITGPSDNSLFKATTDNAITLTLSKLTILDSGSSVHPAILFTNCSHEITITDCTFDNCGSKWGAIQFGHPGTATIDGCTFLNTKETALAGAGAIYISNAGEFTIKNTVIDGVQYTYGSGYMYGVIYVKNQYATLNIENTTITNVNNFDNEQNVTPVPAKAIIYNHLGTVIITGSTIQGNTLSKFNSNKNNIIYNNNGTITIEQTIISDNTCEDEVFCNDGSSTLTVNYCNIQNNTTSGIVNENNDATIDLENNWWGSNTKPDDVTAENWVFYNGVDYELYSGEALAYEIPGLPDPNDDSWGDGDGSEEHPYIIKTPAALDRLADEVNGGNSFADTYFELGADIAYQYYFDWDDADSEENNYTAIGIQTDWDEQNAFSGTFDGKGYTISGIRIYKNGFALTDTDLGIFGCLKDGTVKNVTLADARITGSGGVGGIVGMVLADEGDCLIENCHVLGNVAIHSIGDFSWNFGGIVGNNMVNYNSEKESTISGCTSSATITIGEEVNNYPCAGYGGIVGCNDKGTLRNNLAIGCTIPDEVFCPGAIIGYDLEGKGIIENNYYSDCTIGTATTGIGCGGTDYTTTYHADITANDGAVPATKLTNEPVGSGYLTYNNKYYAPTYRIIEMNTSGIRTFASVADLDFTDIEGLTAYIIDDFDDDAGTLTLSTVGAVPASTGLLLKGTASTTFVVPLAANTTAPTTNYLVGVLDDATEVPVKTDTHTNFILANGSHGINWYTLSEAGPIGAYKAYLSLPLLFTGNAPSFTWVYGDGSTTAIDNGELRIENSTDAWHTLDGQRLSGKPTQRGIYINNGHKVFVK